MDVQQYFGFFNLSCHLKMVGICNDLVDIAKDNQNNQGNSYFTIQDFVDKVVLHFYKRPTTNQQLLIAIFTW